MSAKQIDFLISGIFNSSGQPYKAGKIYFWESSAKTTPKPVWKDADKNDDHSQPVILGNRGEAKVFGDGKYYIEIYTTSNDLIISLDLVDYTSLIDFGGLYIDIGANYGNIAVDIQNAIDDLNPVLNYTFLFQNDQFIISQDLTIPDNVLVKVMPTADLAVSDTFTLTINGAIDAGDYQIFSGLGIVKLTKQQFVYGNWGDNVVLDIPGKSYVKTSSKEIIIGQKTSDVVAEILKIIREKTAPLDDDETHINITALNDALEEIIFAKLKMIQTDVSDSTEAANLIISIMNAGSLTDILEILTTGLNVIGDLTADSVFSRGAVTALQRVNTARGMQYSGEVAGSDDVWYSILSSSLWRTAGHLYIANDSVSAAAYGNRIYAIFANSNFPFRQITLLASMGPASIEVQFSGDILQIRNVNGSSALYWAVFFGGRLSGFM